MITTIAERRQRDADVLARGINVNRIDTWLENIGAAARTTLNANRTSEAAFWAKAYAELMGYRAEIEDGFEPRAMIRLFEDILDRRSGVLRRAISADDDRIWQALQKQIAQYPDRADAIQAAACRVSQNTLSSIRRNCLRCFG